METMVYGKNIADMVLKNFDTLNYDISHTPEHDSISCSLSAGLDAETVLTEIRKEVWEYAGIVRVESELLELTEKLQKWREKILTEGIKCSGSLYLNTMMTHRVHTVLDFAELICK